MPRGPGHRHRRPPALHRPFGLRNRLDWASFECLAEKLTPPDDYALDTETTSLDPFAARIVHLLRHRAGHRLPSRWRHSYAGVPAQLPLDDALRS